MKTTIFAAAFAFATLMAVAAPQVAYADGNGHKVILHVDENDPKKMNLVLNNVQNIDKYFTAKGEKIQIEVVANGPGLYMFRSDKSPVKARLEKLSLAMDNLQLSACGNTKVLMGKKEGMDIPIMDEATMVPAGLVRIMELQDSGWNYIKP